MRVRFSFIRVFFVIIAVFKLSAYAQKPSVTATNDSISLAQHIDRAAALVKLADDFYLQKIDTVIPLCQSAIKLLENISNQNSLFLKAQKLRAAAWNNIGVVYNHYGVQSKALSYYLKALKIREQLKDDKDKVESYNNIALLYKSLNDTTLAVQYYKRGIEIAKNGNDLLGLSNLLNNIAVIYKNNPANYNLALDYYQRSLEIERSLGNLNGIGNRQQNIAVLYHNKNDFEKAEDFYLKSIETKKSINDQKGLMNSYNALSNLEYEKGNVAASEELAKKSLDIARQLELNTGIIQASQTLYEIYSDQKKWQQALQMHEVYLEYTDLQRLEANSNEAKQLQMQYEFDKKITADSLIAADEKKIIEARFKVEKTQRYSLLIGLVLVLVFALFLFNRYKVTQSQKRIIENKEKETYQQKLLVEEQKQLIEKKHKETTDSINYAERIQRSFLATKEELKGNFKEYFVFYKPKDVVSGDFYWASQLKDGKFALVTADSTGHGVPGAIMSILNISSLEKAFDQGFTEPAEVLNHARKTIIDRLKYDGSQDGGKDGMDCSIIVFDFENKLLTYAAANNPIWVVRNNQLIELPYEKMPVGKHDNDHVSFSQHVFSIITGDIIYTITDGFPDQFGGPRGKKFMYKPLKELLVEISNQPLNQQVENLDQKFYSWMGQLEQVDDVTILGIKV